MGTNKSVFTIRNIEIVLADLIMLMVFLPTIKQGTANYTLAAANTNYDIGVSWILYLLPLVILNVALLKQIPEKIAQGIICGATVLDFIMWFVALSQANESYRRGGLKLSGLAIFALIVIGVMAILALFVIITGTSAEAQFTEIFANLSRAQMKNAGGFCVKCGGPLAVGFAVCPRCGNPVAPVVPQQMMQQPMQQMAPQQPMQQMPQQPVQNSQTPYNNFPQ